LAEAVGSKEDGRMSLYAFRSGPEYRAGSVNERMMDALDQPMSVASTLWDQAKGGVVESFGLGTTVRDFAIPEGNVDPEVEEQRDAVAPFLNPLAQAYVYGRRAVQALNPEQPSMSADAYKSSPYFRDDIPWDEGMTEDRAAALASWHDAKKVREFYASKRPITAFIGNLAGQAVDPINYIPVAGQAVRAANVARFGKVGGTAATGAIDAAGNTALFGLATRETRRSFGDDTSWQATVSEIATAALIGSAFGSIAGALGRRSDLRLENVRREAEQRLATLKTTQEARIALNEAINGLARGDGVALSPNATEPLARVANEVQSLAVPATPDLNVVEQIEIGGRKVDIYEADTPPNTPKTYPRAGGEKVLFPVNGVLEEGVVFQNVSGGYSIVRTADGRLFRSTWAAMADAPTPPRTAVNTAARTEGPPPLPVKTIPNDISLNRTASWVIRDKKTKAPVMETFNQSTAERVNTAKYEAVPIGQYLGEINGRSKPAIDTSPARPEPVPEGRAEAEGKIAKSEDYKAIAAQYRVDPETGAFIEEAEIAQVEAEGRLTEDDRSALELAATTYENGAAYGEALKAAVGCLI
jgi:hypothetical protein